MSEVQSQSVLRSAKFDNADDDIKGASAWAIQVREEIRRAASRNANVLVLGTTGTGKDLIARSIHGQSKRAPLSHSSLLTAHRPRLNVLRNSYSAELRRIPRRARTMQIVVNIAKRSTPRARFALPKAERFSLMKLATLMRLAKLNCCGLLNSAP